MEQLEINNLPILKLYTALRKETLPEKAWILVENAKENCLKLNSIGIKHSIDIFRLVENSERFNQITEKTKISKDYLLKLYNRLMFSRFKPIPLTKIEGVNKEYIESLNKIGINKSGNLLLKCKTENERILLSKDTNIPMKELLIILSLADLMRKSGIKSTKARLFLNAGIKSLFMLGQQNPVNFREKLRKFIFETKIVKAVPTQKEMESDIAWSRLHPIIIDRFKR